MTRFILPVIFIGIAVVGFFMFTNPFYQEISLLRAQTASYNEALGNSKALENERDKLTAKYNTINGDDLTKIQKFLPDNIDNIRLILEIEKIAAPYGMLLKDVKYNTNETNNSPVAQGVIQRGGALSQQKDFGVLDLEFSTAGTYSNFINFIKSLESNLRIVDIASISFSSDADAKINSSGIYNYNFKIKTYWLKE